MKQQIKRISIPFVVLLVTMTSCHFNSQYLNRESDKKDAEQITNQFYDLLKSKDYEAMTTLFSEKFFEVTPKDELFRLFTMTSEKLGELQSMEIEVWETKRVEGTNPSANYAFVYKVTYGNFSAKETIRLMREEDGKIRIVSYNVNSDGFITT